MDKDQQHVDRILIAMMVACIPLIFGMLLMARSSDRGTPSMAILTQAGCEVARLAGAKQEVGERPDTCIVRGYLRESLFSGGAQIDQGNGLRFSLSDCQIAGHLADKDFDAPLGNEQIWQRWIGLGIVITALLIVLAAIRSQSKLTNNANDLRSK